MQSPIGHRLFPGIDSQLLKLINEENEKQPKIVESANSSLTCYFAVGGWLKIPQLSFSKVSPTGTVLVSKSLPPHIQFEMVTKRHLYVTGLGHTTRQQLDTALTIFEAYGNFQKGEDDKIPSQEHNCYWLQASVPENLHSEFFRITKYSGAILVSVPVDKIDEAWKSLNTAYHEGRLGYGLKTSTAKGNPYFPSQKIKCIVVHLTNCFDLKKVGQVAWTINQRLKSSIIAMHCVTDYGTFCNCNQTRYRSLDHITKLTQALFNIDLRYFNTVTGEMKPQPLYADHFEKNNEGKAKQMKNLIDDSQFLNGF